MGLGFWRIRGLVVGVVVLGLVLNVEGFVGYQRRGLGVVAG